MFFEGFALEMITTAKQAMARRRGDEAGGWPRHDRAVGPIRVSAGARRGNKRRRTT